MLKSAFLALVDNASGAERLAKEYDNAAGSAQAAADVLGNTFKG